MATSQPLEQAAVYWQAHEHSTRPLQSHQNAMIAACESGDLPALQQLFENYNVKQGDSPIVRFTPESGPPNTWRLITAAVTHKHPSILNFLLLVYPKMDLKHEFIVRAVLGNPDRQILEILQSHPDPNSRPYLAPGSFSNFEWDDHVTTFLTEACRSSEDWLVHYLLDHGADPSLGFSHAGAFWVALTASRSFAVMKDLVDKGAPINGFTMGLIIRHKRADILEFLFSNKKLVHQVDLAMNDPQRTLEDARKTDHEDIVALVKDYIEKREMRGRGKRRLPIMGGEEKPEVGDKESNTEKSWWQFWKAGNELSVEDCNTSDLGSTVNLLMMRKSFVRRRK